MNTNVSYSWRLLDSLASLNVLTAGRHSYRRGDGVNVIALGHLGAVRE